MTLLDSDTASTPEPTTTRTTTTRTTLSLPTTLSPPNCPVLSEEERISCIPDKTPDKVSAVHLVLS